MLTDKRSEQKEPLNLRDTVSAVAFRGDADQVEF